jgi:hypothetical protein
MTDRVRLAAAAVTLTAALLVPALGSAQEPASKSEAAVKELISLLEPRLESGMAFIAAREGAPGHYVGALYLQSVPQLLVITAQYDPAVLMDERLAKRDYREAYTDLNSASKAGTRVFFEDLKVNGLQPKRVENEPFDSYAAPDGKRYQFDGDAKKQKLSDKEYQDAFVAADERYLKAVQALIVEARKKS